MSRFSFVNCLGRETTTWKALLATALMLLGVIINTLLKLVKRQITVILSVVNAPVLPDSLIVAASAKLLAFH